MSLSVKELSTTQIFALSKHIKEKTEGLSCLEEAAHEILKILCCSLITESGKSPFVLARFFKSCLYSEMPSDIQAYINGKESWGGISGQNQYLTLLGSWGDLEEWKNRIHSKNYKAFPLNDPHILDKFPMLSAVFSQIGFELPEKVLPDKSILIKERHKKLKLFCVEEAKGSKFIPKQAEFVEPFSVESCFGFGGMYPTGNIYAIIIFSREKIQKQDASVFLSLNPAIKWATLGYDMMGNIFRMQKNESPSLHSFHREKVENITIEREKSNALIDELEMVNDSLNEEIEKRKRSEDALKSYQAKLEANRRELARSNEELEQFVYTVAHDLKAPLVTSMGFIRMIKDFAEKGEYKKAISKLDQVIQANTRMGQLINDLLELCRVGRIAEEKQYLDMNVILKSFKESLRNRLEKEGFNLVLESAYPTIYANESRVLQVFENLMSNAYKYGRSASGENVVKIGSRENEDEYLFSITDNGQGIPREYHEKIFGLFYRLDNDMDGTGVGLAVVRKVLQFHEGRVWVESEVGKGATFWLAFPKKNV